MPTHRLVGDERPHRARRVAHRAPSALGAGGIMLPNHAPLVIAEQFGTLEALHPGRIDLGLGRAPGTDPVTTPRAAPWPRRRRHVSRRTCSSCRATSPTRRASPAWRPRPAEGTHVPALHPRLVALRRAARRAPRAALRVRVALRAAGARRGASPSTGASSGPRRSSRRRTSSRASTSSPRTRRPTPRRSSPRCSAYARGRSSRRVDR